MPDKMSLKLEGFEQLRKRFDPREFERRMELNIGRETLRNAVTAEGFVKEDIDAGKYQDNSPVTEILKGSTRPLADTGQLRGSIVGEAESWDVAVIGVKKNRRKVDEQTGKVTDMINIALILHEGATVKVTEAMRRLFWAWFRMTGGEIKPLRASTKVIRIPGRKFMRAVLTAGRRRLYVRNWQRGLRDTLAGRPA